MNHQTIRRTIMIFPEFENMSIIDDIRKKYDPLAKHVEPHISLAFTFESCLGEADIREHLASVIENIKPFNLMLQEIIKIDNPLGKYLFLNIVEGNEEIKNLNSRIYTGILEEYKPQWLNEKTFMPHMTIGSFNSTEDLNSAFEDVKLIKESFTTIVDKISVEIVDENEDSIIELEVYLKDK